MSAFAYTAIDENGKKQSGVIEADSARQVRDILRSRQLTPISVTDANKKSSNTILSWRGLSAEALLLITSQLATLLQAALPIADALSSVIAQASNMRIKTILTSVRAKVNEGYTFAQALAQYPRAFPPAYRAAVSSGEQAGHLGDILQRLTEYLERNQAAKQKIQQALLYPLIMTVVSIGIVGFLLSYVVPKIVGVFQQNKQTLPWATTVLLKTSHFLRHEWWLVLLLLIILVWLIKRLLAVPGFAYAWQNFYLKLPVIGKTLRLTNCARYLRTLAMLLQSSVPILEAMQIASSLVLNLPMQAALNRAIATVRDGASLNKALAETQYFPPLSLHLLASGERSGELEKMLTKAALYHEREVERMVDTLLTLFEPLMILLMGAIVLFIVLAIMLPIFSLDSLAGLH